MVLHINRVEIDDVSDGQAPLRLRDDLAVLGWVSDVQSLMTRGITETPPPYTFALAARQNQHPIEFGSLDVCIVHIKM